MLVFKADLEQARTDVAIAAERMVAAEQQAKDLELEVIKLREDLRKSSVRADELSTSEMQLRRDLTAAQNQFTKRIESGGEFSALKARLDEVTEHRDKLQHELLTERERTGNLAAQLTQQRGLLDERRTLALRVHELETVLQRANTVLDEYQQAQLLHAETAARLQTMRRDNLALRAEVARLRSPVDDEDDALIPLMKDRVKALDLLAMYQKQAGKPVTGQPLPKYTEQAILDAARSEAFKARRDFYFRTLWPNEPKPRWVVEDRLLDPESEKKIRAQQEDKLKRLFGSVTIAKSRVGERH